MQVVARLTRPKTARLRSRSETGPERSLLSSPCCINDMTAFSRLSSPKSRITAAMGTLQCLQVARLVYLTGGTYQAWAALWAFFFPKLLVTFWTDRLDFLVQPTPILQVVNLVLGCAIVAINWKGVNDRFRNRQALGWALLVLHLVAVLPAFLMYQTTNVAIYLTIGSVWWAVAIWRGEFVGQTASHGLGVVTTADEKGSAMV